MLANKIVKSKNKPSGEGSINALEWFMQRRFFVAAMSLAPFSFVSMAKGPDIARLRFVQLRQSSFLIEMGDRRILVDPSFEKDLGQRPFASASAPALRSDELGALDVIAVTSSNVAHFSTRNLKVLSKAAPYCLVPSEEVAKKMRHLGFRRVRVVRASNEITIRGLRILVSPAESPHRGQNVGYRFEYKKRSVWHSGTQNALDDEAAIVRFAKANVSELLLACAGGEGTKSKHLMGLDDATALGRFCKARVIVPHHLDLVPNFLGTLIGLEASSLKSKPLRRGLRIVQKGQWNRLLKSSS